MPTKRLVTRYEDDLRLFPDRWHWIGLFVLAAFVFVLPFVASAQWLTVANLSLVAIVGSVGMMILTGFAGQISLGHAAFLALGAYGAAILGNHLHLPYWLVLPASGFIAAAFGLAVGPFALRLEGLYLAIVTVGLLFIVDHFLLHGVPELSGAYSGTSVPMHSGFTADPSDGSLGDFWQNDLELGFATLEFPQKLYFLFLPIAAFAAWTSKNLARSNSGRAMMAVRDHDLAAAVLGVNPAKAKIVAFGVSSFYAGVAGAMFAFQQSQISLNGTFGLEMSVNYIAMIVLGGIGTTFGAVAGAITLTLLSPLAELIAAELPLLQDLQSTGQQSALLGTIVVVGFLVFEPLGLLGIWLRIKRYFIAWPFRY